MAFKRLLLSPVEEDIAGRGGGQVGRGGGALAGGEGGGGGAAMVGI